MRIGQFWFATQACLDHNGCFAVDDQPAYASYGGASAGWFPQILHNVEGHAPMNPKRFTAREACGLPKAQSLTTEQLVFGSI